jgi:hypothetical protein
MVGPWGLLSGFPAAATIDVEDIDDGPPGVLAVGPTATTTDVGDVDGGPSDFHGDKRRQTSKVGSTL